MRIAGRAHKERAPSFSPRALISEPADQAAENPHALQEISSDQKRNSF
jgi:hypothetical protein